MRPLNIGTEKALEKIKHYCAYQERSHDEVRDKLYSFGLYKNEVEQLLTQLLEENYLNEERFAIAFAGGKFRMKGWGKVKIKYELRQKGVSDYCIKKALMAIEEDRYSQTLEKLVKEKLALLRTEKNIFIRKKKLQQFLLQRGFESHLVNNYVNNI